MLAREREIEQEREREKERENREREREKERAIPTESQRASNKKNGQPRQNITSLLYSEITF